MAFFLSIRLKKSRTRIACPALFGRATHEAHPAPHAKGVAGSGPHSPLGGRGACSPDGERANIRAKREIPEIRSRVLQIPQKRAIMKSERRWKHENRIQRSQTKEKGYIFFTWNICCGMFPCCAWKTMVVFFHPIDVFPVGFHSCPK